MSRLVTVIISFALLVGVACQRSTPVSHKEILTLDYTANRIAVIGDSYTTGSDEGGNGPKGWTALAWQTLAMQAVQIAADVGADQLRMNAISQYGAADGTIFAGMEIRHGRDRADAGQSCDLLELKRGVTLDPGLGRGEDADRRAAVHLGRSAH